MKDNYVGPEMLQKYIHPPFWWLYSASAKIHDDNYKKGGTKADRLEADLGFLHRILLDANDIKTYNKKRVAVLTAITYYVLVRGFGWLFFKK